MRSAVSGWLGLGVMLVGCGGEPKLDGEHPVAQGWWETCPSELALARARLAYEADYVALVEVATLDGEVLNRTERAQRGSPCSGATDRLACLEELEATVPSSTGWGYCGEGCWDEGIVTTVGDEVHLYDSPEEVLELLGEVDTFWDAIVVTWPTEYWVDCPSTVETEAGTYQFLASRQLSDCPVTSVREVLEVSRDGTLEVLREVSRESDDVCI